jgi:hypothetical protein
MALTSAERKLITVGNKALRERLAFKRDLEQEIRRSTVRRAKIGDNYREKMLAKALKNAGVDYDLIRQRQAKEAEAAPMELRKWQARLNKNAKTVAERHQQLREQLRRTKIHPIVRSSPPPSPEDLQLGYLPTPSNTDLDDDNTPQNAVITPGAHPNDGVNLTFDWKTNVTDGWTASITAFFDYLWTPSQAGTIGIFSTAAFNGTGSWSINASCGYGGFVDVKLNSSVKVQQVDAAGHLNSFEGVPTTGIQDNHNAGCTHHRGSKPYDQVDFLQLAMPFAVEKKLPVKISIQIDGFANAELGAGCEVDFSSNSMGINLPGIYFGFTPED